MAGWDWPGAVKPAVARLAGPALWLSNLFLQILQGSESNVKHGRWAWPGAVQPAAPTWPKINLAKRYRQHGPSQPPQASTLAIWAWMWARTENAVFYNVFSLLLASSWVEPGPTINGGGGARPRLAPTSPPHSIRPPHGLT